MVIKYVEKPKLKRRRPHRYRDIFAEFLATDVKLAEITLSADEYKNIVVAYNCLFKAAKSHGVPIRVFKNDDKLYFERTDI